VNFTAGGDYRSGRQARWRFEVKDAQGQFLPPRRLSGFVPAGGQSQSDTLKYGESWATDLEMNKFVEIPAPGTYAVRILYHDSETIVDRVDTVGLITCSSLPIRLEVSPIVVGLTAAQAAAIRQAIQELPKEGGVKLIEGPYHEGLHTFIKPTSPAGRLLDIGFAAIPQLIESSLSNDLNPTQRAWSLAILTSLTGYNDPRHEAGVLSDYDVRTSDWSIWGGAPGVQSGGLGLSSTTVSSGGAIDVDKQKEFAKRWAVWNEKKYVEVVKDQK
jgi:hypothetical protein